MIGVLVICTALAVLPPLIRQARAASWRLACTNNLKQIGLALVNYHDVHRTFPCAITYAADGTPMRSWRIAVLPYVTQQSLYDQYDFDEPWNGPHNGRFADEIPGICSPNTGVSPVWKLWTPRRSVTVVRALHLAKPHVHQLCDAD